MRDLLISRDGAYNSITTRVPYVFLHLSGGCYNERLAISRDGARCVDSTQEPAGAGIYLFYFYFLSLARWCSMCGFHLTALSPGVCDLFYYLRITF